MSKKRVTSQQVAERAGVSRTTVSLVLNNVATANISTATRQRVLAVAKELNYVPDVAARTLASGRSNNIGLILFHPHPHIFADSYISGIIAGLTPLIQTHGFRLLIQIIEDVHVPNMYMDLMKGKEIAGMILSNPRADDKEITALATSNFPVISLDYLNEAVFSVSSDDLGGVRQVVEHLVALGHQQIACITYAPIQENNQVAQRLDVFRETLVTHGLTYNESLVRFGNRDPETGYDVMRDLLDQVDPLPTALFAMNDVIAFGAIKAIKEYGLRIPDDIAVVGFDNILLANFTDPPLTTISKSNIQQGQLAGQLLIDLINGISPTQPQISIDTALIIRASCGATSHNQSR